VAHYLERTYSGERILHPMRRVGRKGEGRFERIGWDEALTTIADRFRAIAASPDGPQAIVPYSYAGTMGLLQYASMDRRFFHRLGASLLERTICASAGKAGWIATVGSSGTYPVDSAALERQDLIRGAPRSINMTTIGDALLGATDPPIRAIYVYNANPVAVAPEVAKVAAGFAREDLFCVVHEIFQADTADYADLLLPATTQLEHLDVHSSYGHLYALANNPSIAPVGEAKPNTQVFRELAARMGFDEPCFSDSDEAIARQAFKANDPRAAGVDWERLKVQGFQRLAVPQSYAPFAEGGFATPSGKCEFHSATLAAQGHDPLPTFVPPRESVASNPGLARRYPLAFISPPARNFLNSSFANLPRFVAEEGAPRLDLHPDDAEKRGIAIGDKVRILNDRGSTATARVTDRTRPGVVVSPSIWWKKLTPDGANANAVTSQALTDFGRAATFYDCLVEVRKI
jgi:anaerobic selenocysteine-containing dehydrogenase